MCFFSHKFGKVEADGFQYCEKCGKARKPSITVPPNPCANGHKWKKLEERQVVYKTRNIFGEPLYKNEQTVYVMQCENCGVLKNYNATTGSYNTEEN